ncbi:Hypp7974 [Branchiostoma lanceolatum]|uniref:Hypp7974 protein n=1 Tax=Branchiostoma lanceolatum TaxID=7740 RepID=A0A8K0EDD4_BRALA|nr:Hypp7974 [Branchiostoma lanceolatum]
MWRSTCFLLLLIVCIGSEIDYAYRLQNLQGSFRKLALFFKGLEREGETFAEAFGKLKVIDEELSTQHRKTKTIREELDVLEPRLVTMAETFDYFNNSVGQKHESLNSRDEYWDGNFNEREEEIESFSVIMDEYLADIGYGNEEQRQSITESVNQEADRQGQVRYVFRQDLQDYERAREEKRTEMQGLMQTVNSQIAAVRLKDQRLDERTIALQTKVQLLIQEVAGLGTQLSEQRSQLETHEATLSGEDEQLTNVRNSFETHVQRHDQIRQLLETLQATVMVLRNNKTQIQNQTANINTQIQDQQSRFNNSDQQKKSLKQQTSDLSGKHEQQSNAKSLRLDGIEARLDTLAADTGIADSVTQMESTMQNLHANMTGLTSRVDQNQNLQKSIQQQQVSQQQSIQTEDAALQAFNQTLGTFDEQIETSNATYQQQVSTEEERLQTAETQVTSAVDSIDSETIITLQNLVDGLSTDVDVAGQQFDQYPSPSAMLDDFASVDQSIQWVEDTQTSLTTLEQQLSDSMSASEEKFDELETSLLTAEESLQQAQSDLELTAQIYEGAFDLSGNIAGLGTRVTANTQESSAFSSSVQEVDTNYRQAVQTQQAAIQEKIDAIPDEQVQQAMTAAFEADMQEFDNKLDNMETSVDDLEAHAVAIGTSSESTYEMIESDLDTVTTQLSNHQSAINALQRSQQDDGLAESVNTLEQNVAEISSTTDSLSGSINGLLETIQQPGSSFDHYEWGTWHLPEIRNFWSQSQSYGSKEDRYVNFDIPFQRTPVIFVTISKIDMDDDHRNSFEVSVTYATRTYFRMSYGPGYGSAFYAGTVEWIALGTRG